MRNMETPHLRCKKGDLAPIALLPGDPGRVELIGTLLDGFSVLSQNREFKVARGSYKGTPITVCSTGIGGPSTEIAVVELARLGVTTFIRVGGTGAIVPEIACGDLIISAGSVRLGGSSQFYVRPEYPAVASYEIVLSLVEACERLGYSYHVGIGASIGSFYEGQGRISVPARRPGSGGIVQELQQSRVINIEMEADTVLTLANALGFRGGAIYAVHCNRITDEWDPHYEKSQGKLVSAACEAASLLARWDSLKERSGKKHLSLSLIAPSGTLSNS
ncbi:MAG TPA: nucleoside phosphorylase [Firmicutes bacterium]|nr:nucleoside phosphorylase [Bacillota bacterium]